MPQIPRDALPDSTPALLMDGYDFIGKRCRKLQSDIFQARILLRKSICMKGEAASRLFHDNEFFLRKNSAPARLQKTLLGQGGVQGMDGEAHRHRKQMFMSLMTPESIDHLSELTAQHWRAYLKKWEAMDQVVLFFEVEEILCRAVCAWAGVPLEESEVAQRTQDFEAMIDASGAVGLRHMRGRRARGRCEKWLGEIIGKVRRRHLQAAEGTALYAVAWHHDTEGELLDSHTASVELLNFLRPTVAVSRFIIFSALALHQYPWEREKLKAGGDEYSELFVQEVRRFYPFFPFVGARVRKNFQWRGYRFPKGTRVFLDLYGTDHDPAIWQEPEEFRPERFRDWNGSAFNFIPQGGGDHYLNHRCPGEWITKALMKTALNFFVNKMEYALPEQNLHVSLKRIPAIPRSRILISDCRLIQTQSQHELSYSG